MLKVQIRNVVIWAALILLAGLSLVQFVQLKLSNDRPENAVYLLHNVSAFQFEMLSGSLQEAVNAGMTDELSMLRDSLYTANYIHEQLVLAVGTNRLTELSSLMDTLQYILRLQAGGNRPVQASEQEVLTQLNEKFHELFMNYRQLFTEDGDIIKSRTAQLAKLDEGLTTYLERLRR